MASCWPARPAPARYAGRFLVALGLRADGKKEVIDFRLAASESAAEWEKFLANRELCRQGRA